MNKKFSELSNRVIGCAIEVHRILGPGLLESTYEQCLAHELKINDINFKLQCQAFKRRLKKFCFINLQYSFQLFIFWFSKIKKLKTCISS